MRIMDLHLQEISFTLAWIGDRPFKDNTVSTAVMQTSQLKNLHSLPHQNQRCLLIFSLLITQFKSINMYIYILENDT